MSLPYIEKYFPDLSERQKDQFEKLINVCTEWNRSINVISRKDIDNLEIHHILHSLAIAKFIDFKPGSIVIDLGTGGGFPALPLAILFPEVKFHLVDRIAKKLKVAQEIANSCGLQNVSFQHGDFKECKIEADFVVSRAVMPQNDLLKLARKNISRKQCNAIPNGLISLKGGDLKEEISATGQPNEVINLSTYFEEPFFITKKLIYNPI